MSANKQDNGLNGARVIATLAIALFHFELSYPFIQDMKIFSTSYLFVEFFFILSGFLFAKGLLGSHSNDSLITTIKNKLIRLWPAYIAGLIILPIIYSMAWYEGNYINWLSADNHYISFIVESIMLQAAGLSNFIYINGPAWYVSSLIISFIPTYFLIKYIKKYQFLMIISIILYLIIWIFESPSMSTTAFIFGFVPVPLIRGLAGVILGTACYKFYFQKSTCISELNKNIRNIAEILCVLLVLYLTLFKTSDWQNCLIIIPFSILIISFYSSNEGLIGKFLSNKKWRFLSEISYSFYITQSFCSNIFTCLAPNVTQPWVTIWYITLNLCIAMFIHLCWEIPCTKYLNKLFTPTDSKNQV